MSLKSKLKRKLVSSPLWPIYTAWKEKRLLKAELKDWRMRGRPIPTGNTYKRELIKKFAKTFKMPIFIETGTFLGGTVESMLKEFNNIYSIEVEPNLYKAAKEKFASYEHVTIINGDSSDEIKNILKDLKKPALFWLDAHYSAGITGKGKEDSALRVEVELICEHINSKQLMHVMLLDDSRDFSGTNGYPTVSEVMQHVMRNLPGYTVELRDDVLRIYPPIKGKLVDWN